MSRELGHWEAYYRGGAVVSCPMGRADGYDGEVRAAWEAFFGELPDGARIVDLGTGNGALPLIACEVAQRLGRAFEIHGIDRAAIDPLRDVPGAAVRLAGVTFHPGTAAERLPFPDSSVSAVCSQYGIEYADVERALAEAARILAPGGRLQLIAHHADSVVTDKARATLALATQALREPTIFELTRIYLRAERERAPHAAAVHADLAARSAGLREAAAQSSEPLFANATLDWLARVFDERAREHPDVLMQRLAAAETAARAWMQRLQDLLAAAWSPERAGEVAAYAEGLGLRVADLQPQLHAAGALVGWRMRADRR